MLRKNVYRSSGELLSKAISQKSRSHAIGVFRGIGERPTSKKPAVSAKAEAGRFCACECSHALLAADWSSSETGGWGSRNGSKVTIKNTL